MGPKTAYIRRFDGGIFNDPRVPNAGLSRVVTNFDILTNPYKMTPYHSSASGDSAAATSQKQNFVLANWLPGSTNDYRVFSLGVVSGSGKAEILMKTMTTGSSNDLSDASWASPANNASAAGLTNFNLFVWYKKTNLIYGAKAGTSIWAFDSGTAGAFTETSLSLAYTNIAQGCVHPVDDILYVPYDNKIAKNDNGTWSAPVLTLPSNYYITSICPYRNFLAIACAPLSGEGGSRVFLWDRDTSLATVSESIDWGEGNIKVIEELNGDLVGISQLGNITTRFFGRLIFKRYTGYGAEKIGEFVSTSISSVLTLGKQKINNRLHFMAQIILNGSAREGVFSIGRNPGQPYAIIHERTPNNDTALSGGFPVNFFYIGDFLFQSYISSGSYGLSKTDDQNSYTASSIYESEINEGMDEADRPALKQLMSVGANYEALPAAGQAVVQYRVDGGSWVTVFTETTDGAVYTEPVPNAASGDEFVQGKDYEFRCVSTGGAEMTGITYKFLNLSSNV